MQEFSSKGIRSRMIAIMTIVCLAVMPGMSASNPGLQIRLSQGGLNYAANVAVDELSQRIVRLRVPDQSGTANSPIKGIEYQVTNIKVTNFMKPTSSVTVNPDSGFTWTLNNVGLSVSGDWRYKYKRRFLSIRDHGGIDGMLSETSASVSVVVGMDAATGRPTIATGSCNIIINTFSITLSGGASWLYNLFMQYLEKPLKESLQELICKEIRDEIDDFGRSELSDLQLQIPVGDLWMFDYRLLSSPKSDQLGFIDFFHKGEFFLKGDSTEAPFQPEPFPVSESNVPMLTVWISDYVINTIGYALYRHGWLSYNLNGNSNVSLSEKNFLRTSCNGSSCFGSFVRNVGVLYPNASAELEMTASEPPQIEISQKAIRGKAFSRITYRARLANGSSVYLFKTNVTISVGLRAEIQNASVLKGELIRFLPSVSVADSNIGPVSEQVLGTVFKFASAVFVVPKLKEALQKGVLLPQIKNVKFTNSNLAMESHCLRVTADVVYAKSIA